MVEKLSFDLQQFREAQSVVQKMQNEFCKLVEEKIQKMDSFGGQYVRRPTGAKSGKMEEEVFFSKIDVAGISVDLTIRLNWRITGWYELGNFEIRCDELSIIALIDRKKLNDFKIFFKRGDIRCGYRVRV